MEVVGAYWVFVKKTEGRRSLGRPKCKWENNIKINLRKVGWGHGLDLTWLRIGTGDGLL